MNEHRRVWVRDQEKAWAKATVLNEGDRTQPHRTLSVQNDDTMETTEYQVDASGESEDVKSLNLFEDDSDVRGYEDVHDLTNLAHLHEAEILESLCVRFKSDVIYTYTGPILLAVNPFKPLDIYSEDKLGTFYSAGLLKAQNLEGPELEPHVFAIADNAYRNLMAQGAKQSADQSILVSGESGAGKTETTKYVMRFLATVAKSEDDKTSGTGRAERVLESNPILESFGNARTNRNDNSSRFGKFIQMSFNPKGFLVGAQIATYLLEKVRLTKQGEGERNFHVFYQMCAGASEEDRQAWLLPKIDEAAYTNESGVYDRRDNVLDGDQFARTDEAFDKMKFTSDERNAIYSVASAVLNMGNITFAETSAEGSEVQAKTLKYVDNVATLLQVDKSLLDKALTSKTITTGKESFVKPLDVAEALVTRDALAKTVFSRLFDWLVKRVNSAIASDGAANTSSSRQQSFIGVLDIFGFEVFAHNSFEQLCINYANETLQQQFNEFIFQLEQKLYESEKIAWNFIDFPDNKPVLDLIEERKPKPGILALLDEQCLVPGGNDKTLANKLYEMHGGDAPGGGPKSSPAKAPVGSSAAAAVAGSDKKMEEDTPLLFASKIDKVKFNFNVRHYAGAVCYSALGFCAKNKDELREEALDLMRTSTRELVIELFPETVQKKGSVQSATVGSQFRSQLASLLTTIKATSPHYVRCLKPNDINVRDVLVRPRLVDQLRYGGVLEAVKVARAGYPTRYMLRDFVRRYFMLSQNLQQAFARRAQTFAEDDVRWVEACEAIVNGPQKLEKGMQYQIGRTKVFLRKSAFEQLETGRSQVLKENAIQIQKIGRGFVHYKRFTVYMRSLKLIQKMARGFIARRRVRAIKRNNAAVVMQAIVRQYCKRSIFNRMKMAAVAIQAMVRGKFGRDRALQYKRNVMAIKLQCFVRMSTLRRKLLKQRAAAIQVQTQWRGKSARMELKRLKEEQREVGFFKVKIQELQNKVLELEDKLKNQGSFSAVTAASSEDVEALKKQHAEELARLAAEASSVSEAEFTKLRLELETQKVENERLLERSGDGEELGSLRLQTEQQQAEIARLSQAALKENGLEANAMLEALTKERDALKDALLAAADTSSTGAAAGGEDVEAEIAALKLKHEIEIAELIRERDTLMEGGGSDALLGKTIAERDSMKLEVSQWQLKYDQIADQLATEKQAHLDVQFELTRVKQDRDAKVQQMANVESELDAQVALVEQLRGERDSLAAGTESADVVANAFKERDAASAKLVQVTSEAEQLKHQLSLLESEVSNHKELVATLKSSLESATSEDAHHELQDALNRAVEEKQMISQERDSLAELLSVSADDEGGFQRVIADREKAMAQQRQEFELEIKKLKLERDTTEHALRQEKKLAAKTLEEKQNLLATLNASSAASSPTASSSTSTNSNGDHGADLVKLETERARLVSELKQAEKERDETKQQLALLKVVSHSNNASVTEDLDMKIAQTSLEAMTLERDVMIKEKEDMMEENAKYKARIEELMVMETALKNKINELSQAAPAKSRFFYRAPAVAAAATPASAAAAGDSTEVTAALTSRIKELEKEFAQVKKQKEDLLSRTMHLMSEMATKEIEMKKQKRTITDLEEKIEAMSLLAEQTSAIKIKLARRLDSLVHENHRLTQSFEESQDQLAAMMEVSRVLNTELLKRDTPAAAAKPPAPTTNEE